MLLSSLGELRPSRMLPVFADWLARHKPALDRRDKVVDLVAPQILSNAADAVKRTPYFCSGCPHNTSTKVPEGSIAQAGIGCHFMASWMERDTTGLIQMGGEGVDWASHSHVHENAARLPESRRRHLLSLGLWRSARRSRRRPTSPTRSSTTTPSR
jgi:indolepyruvate ferredoxin oxidoreductase